MWYEHLLHLLHLSESPRTVDGELPARRCPTPCRSRMPDGGPQCADDGVVEAIKLSTRRLPTPGRSRMPDDGPQSVDDGVVEASELPARHRRRSPGHSRMPDDGTQSADDGVIEAIELPARPQPRVGSHPANAGCRTAARRVQMMELSKPESSPRASAPH